MNKTHRNHPDAARAHLRDLIEVVQGEINQLQRVSDEDKRASITQLSESFTALVDELMLGPQPDVRPCGVCGELGMAAATLCMHCWSKLTPATHAERAATAAAATTKVTS